MPGPFGGHDWIWHTNWFPGYPRFWYVFFYFCCCMSCCCCICFAGGFHKWLRYLWLRYIADNSSFLMSSYYAWDTIGLQPGWWGLLVCLWLVCRMKVKMECKVRASIQYIWHNHNYFYCLGGNWMNSRMILKNNRVGAGD